MNENLAGQPAQSQPQYCTVQQKNRDGPQGPPRLILFLSSNPKPKAYLAACALSFGAVMICAIPVNSASAGAGKAFGSVLQKLIEIR